jgi:hypothetical protein
MPWNPRIFAEVCSNLQQAAEEGRLVPGVWVDAIVETEDGPAIRGCVWGITGWTICQTVGTVAWAKMLMPIRHKEVKLMDVILQHAGLTEGEIEYLGPKLVWTYFDESLQNDYDARHEDWERYIKTSRDLAYMFIALLRRVPVDHQPTPIQRYQLVRDDHDDESAYTATG